MKNKMGKDVYSWGVKWLQLGYRWIAQRFRVFYKTKEIEKREIIEVPQSNFLVPRREALAINNEAEQLKKAIQYLNEAILLESDLFIVLHEVDYSPIQLSPRSNLYFKEPVNRAVFLLRNEVHKIKERDLKVIVNQFLFQYEALSKYLIFIFSDALNEAFVYLTNLYPYAPG